MADTGKNPFMDMFQNFGQNLNLPGADVNGIIDYHRKNLQALQAATQVSSNTAQALLEKQRAALEETLADIAETVQDVTKGADAASMAQAPMDVARKAFEATLQNTREMAEIVQQGNADTFQILKDRVMESIEDVTGKSNG